MSEARARLARHRRWVVKIGSSLVTAQGRGLDHAAIADWSAQIAALCARGIQVVLVSSGAVAEGMARLSLPRRPELLHQLQATAAVGQMGLIRAWEHAFQGHALRAAQILLTHEDVADRRRYLNARATLGRLLDLRAVIASLGGQDPGAASSVRKLVGVQHRQAVAEACLRRLGPDGAVAGPEDPADARYEFLLTRCLSIAGGTTQILRTAAAERILGLPRG